MTVSELSGSTSPCHSCLRLNKYLSPGGEEDEDGDAYDGVEATGKDAVDEDNEEEWCLKWPDCRADRAFPTGRMSLALSDAPRCLKGFPFLVL